MNINEALNVLGIDGIEVTKEDVKKAYKRSAMKYHPDRNPQGELMMKVINEAYEVLKDLDIEVITRTKNKQDEYDIYDFGELINNVLNVLGAYPELILEVVGNWLWITGETKTHKDLLKSLKCFYAPKKQAWYFRPEEHKSRSRGDCENLDDIKNKYGSWKYKNQPKRAIQQAI